MDRRALAATLVLANLTIACERAATPADAARARLAAWGVTVTPESLVWQARNLKHTEPASDLLSLGVSPDAVDASGTPAVVAGARNVEYLRVLLAAGANPDAVDADGRAALHRANEATIDLLVRAGATLDIQDAHGCTPLHDAVIGRDAARVAALLAAGASPDIGDEHGRTPLMEAVLAATPEVLRRVLEANPSLELTDEEGYTALLLAVRRVSGFVPVLLRAGASPHAVARDGRSAVELANTEYVQELLVAAGATPPRSWEAGQ